LIEEASGAVVEIVFLIDEAPEGGFTPFEPNPVWIYGAVDLATRARKASRGLP
jgi:hypothetical protein